MNTTPLTFVQEERVATLTAEHLVFGLLGKVLLEFPNRVWLQSLITERVFDEIPLPSKEEVQAGARLLRSWTEENPHGLDDDLFEEITLDYTRLFIGPDRVLAPPWESVYFNENRLTFQEETLEVRRWYREFGLESTSKKREPDDHIGLELGFLAHLASQAVVALEEGNHDDALRILQAQERFLNKHLATWVTLWAEEVCTHARTEFWKGIALLTEGYVTVFKETISAELAEGRSW